MKATLLILNFLGLLMIPSTRAQGFDWRRLPAGQWVPVPTHGQAAPKIFHGGATIVPERGLVVFFGSDTHAPTPLENGESNALWRLDLETLNWSQDYDQDPKSSYRILPDGQCVTTNGRPWAMHTFANVVWDPEVQRVVVISAPIHTRFDPRERFPMFTAEDWWLKLRQSHWEYDLDQKQWSQLEVDAPEVFAAATVRDPGSGKLIAHNGSLTWEFDRRFARWSVFGASSKPGWHLNMVYDTFARRVLLLGNNSGDTTLYGYDPAQHRWKEVACTGPILPANGAAIAYDTRNQAMLYLANDYEDQYHNPTGRSATFMYHSRNSRWVRLEIDSPPLFGMNYLMQYDPVRNVVLHFEKTADSGDRIRLWAFRLDGP